MLQAPMRGKMKKINSSMNIRNLVCATCLSSNRTLHSMKNFSQFLNLCNDVMLVPEDSICWECKATFTKILQFRKRALQSKSVLTCLLQPRMIPNTGQKAILVNCLSSLTTKLINTFDAEFLEVNNEEECSGVKAEVDDYKDVKEIIVQIDPIQDQEVSENPSEIKVFTIYSKNIKTVNKTISDDDMNTADERPQSVFVNDAAKPKTRNYNSIDSIDVVAEKMRKKEIKEGKFNTSNKQVLVDVGYRGDGNQQPVTEPNYDFNSTIDFVSKKVDEKEMLEMRRRKENSRHYKSSDFKCVHCLDYFMKKTVYEKHMLVHSQEDGPYKCKICHLGFKCAKEMENHVESHYIIYLCPKCDFKHLEYRNMSSHYNSHHRKDFECKICEKQCSSKKALTEHGAMAHRGKKICSICGKGFMCDYNLKQHLVTHDINVPIFECDICHKKYRRKLTLEKHINYVHKNQSEPIYCVKCDKTYRSELTYLAHLKWSRSHGNTSAILRYECAHCGYKCNSKTSLQYHIEMIHLKLGNYVCKICNKVCHAELALGRHERKAHGARPMRSHVCHLCGKAYMIRKTLQQHLFSHQGLRPYQCKVCDATFSYSGALYTHNRLKHLKKTSEKSEADCVSEEVAT